MCAAQLLHDLTSPNTCKLKVPLDCAARIPTLLLQNGARGEGMRPKCEKQTRENVGRLRKRGKEEGINILAKCPLLTGQPSAHLSSLGWVTPDAQHRTIHRIKSSGPPKPFNENGLENLIIKTKSYPEDYTRSLNISHLASTLRQV